MSKIRLKKILAMTLLTALVGSTFLGCGSTENTVSSGNVEQKIVYNIDANPKTIDPQLNSAVDGSKVIRNTFEGLMREIENGEVENGIAEGYEVSEDGLVYTFHIRDNAKWSDGEDVTAKDFEYAWKRALNPNTAAEYAYQLFYIKNGEAYNKGEASADDVGIKVVDNKTIEVTLESAVPYFVSLLAMPVYYPVRQDIIEENGDKWALSPETYVSNGPFKMTEWSEKKSMTFIKNENYWDADNVKLETLVFRLIDDQTTTLSAFKNGELDIMEQPPTTEIQSLIDEGVAKVYPYLGTYFYMVNVSGKGLSSEAVDALQDVRVRKALSLAIDRNLITEKVSMGGEIPATSYVPEGVKDTQGNTFHKDYSSVTTNIEEAKKLLEEAGYPNGQGFPTITFTYNTASNNQMIAQAIQDMWKTNLGINVELKNEEWAVFQTTRNNFQYEICRHGWIGDYNDPMTFLDMWVTASGQNNAGYSNEEYDSLIAQAKSEQDGEKRTELLRKAEDILMDDMAIIPIYYYTNIVCANDNVKGYVKSPLGSMLFRQAYVE
ncbi:peptide ABC transporter substrate-binding protein [Sarcina ventriculi]|uniref:peptide ABC transporter substrate-binding protein n=1 Tax=Sarcina ventriculi TaxID=1267 RepID=UPI0018AA4F86|nr:peptide ABC transporter substrate-binding protein [Sarcina ventriculi]